MIHRLRSKRLLNTSTLRKSSPTASTGEQVLATSRKVTGGGTVDVVSFRSRGGGTTGNMRNLWANPWRRIRTSCTTATWQRGCCFRISSANAHSIRFSCLVKMQDGSKRELPWREEPKRPPTWQKRASKCWTVCHPSEPARGARLRGDSRLRRRPSRISPREQAAAQERAFQRTVAVQAAAAEAGGFACGIKSADDLAVAAEHARVQVGLKTAQRLSRQDVELDRDQRAVVGIENPMRLCGADQSVTDIPARI